MQFSTFYRFSSRELKINDFVIDTNISEIKKIIKTKERDTWISAENLFGKVKVIIWFFH